MRIGIDLGGTKIELIALASNGTELLRKRVSTPKGSYESTLDAIISLIHNAESTLQEKGSLGIGIPGTLSPDHGHVKNANSTCLIGKDLKGDIEVRLKRHIRIANDADCFTLSEASDGSAASAASVFGVIIGTGVGGGIAINQSLISGPNAICGEWGHNPLPWQTQADHPIPPCYCGKKGCIESYLSGPGFERDYLSLSKEKKTAIEIAKRINSDPYANEAIEKYINRFARSLSTVINILDPEVIVLGGGMSNIDAIYQGVEKVWQNYVFSDKVNTKICKALHGDSSGVRGAAWLWPEA